MTRLRFSVLALGLIALASSNANAGWRSYSAGIQGSRGVSVSVTGGSFVGGTGRMQIGKNNFRHLRNMVTANTTTTAHVAGHISTGYRPVHHGYVSGAVVTRPVVHTHSQVHAHGQVVKQYPQTTVTHHAAVVQRPTVVAHPQATVVTHQSHTVVAPVVTSGTTAFAISGATSGGRVVRPGGLEIGKNNFRTLRKAVFGR